MRRQVFQANRAHCRLGGHPVVAFAINALELVSACRKGPALASEPQFKAMADSPVSVFGIKIVCR
jgi:hypothetical protein